MELSHESHGVSSREILLLAVINGQIHVDLGFSLGSDGVWDFLEVLVISCALQSVDEILVLFGVVESLGSIWIEVTKVVEVLLSQSLTLGIAHLWLVERVVDNLESLPVGLSLE